jgi:exonuclease VII small subunit
VQGLGHQLMRWVTSLDGNSLALVAAWLTVLAWYKGVATTAGVEKSVTDSEKRVEKSVKDSEEHTKERVEGVQKSVDNLRSEMKTVVTWPSLLSYVGILAVGIAGGAFVAWKLKK